MSASPESFSRIRLYAGEVGEDIERDYRSSVLVAGVAARSGGFADLEPREPADGDRLAESFCSGRQHVVDGHFRVANGRLIRQHGLLIEASELAFDDLVDHVGGLARL